MARRGDRAAPSRFVKLLIDMNLPPVWVEVLRKHGWEAVHWSQIGDPRSSDRDIMEWARKNGYVVFTHDLDFGSILAATAERTKRHPGPYAGRDSEPSGVYRSSGSTNPPPDVGSRGAANDRGSALPRENSAAGELTADRRRHPPGDRDRSATADQRIHSQRPIVNSRTVGSTTENETTTLPRTTGRVRRDLDNSALRPTGAARL